MLFCYYSYWLCHAHIQVLYHLILRNRLILYQTIEAQGWRGYRCITGDWRTKDRPESSTGREKTDAEDWEEVMFSKLVMESWKKQKRSQILGNL